MIITLPTESPLGAKVESPLRALNYGPPHWALRFNNLNRLQADYDMPVVWDGPSMSWWWDFMQPPLPMYGDAPANYPVGQFNVPFLTSGVAAMWNSGGILKSPTIPSSRAIGIQCRVNQAMVNAGMFNSGQLGSVAVLQGDIAWISQNEWAFSVYNPGHMGSIPCQNIKGICVIASATPLVQGVPFGAGTAEPSGFCGRGCSMNIYGNTLQGTISLHTLSGSSLLAPYLTVAYPTVAPTMPWGNGAQPSMSWWVNWYLGYEPGAIDFVPADMTYFAANGAKAMILWFGWNQPPSATFDPTDPQYGLFVIQD